jgi:hypothetical protein
MGHGGYFRKKRKMGWVCPTLRDSEVNRLRQKFWPVIVAFVDFIQQRILQPAHGVQIPLDLRAYFDGNAYRNQPHLTDSDFSSTWIASDPLTKQTRLRYSPAPYRTSSYRTFIRLEFDELGGNAGE